MTEEKEGQNQYFSSDIFICSVSGDLAGKSHYQKEPGKEEVKGALGASPPVPVSGETI